MAVCKITITDEVNCKLSGLELTERKYLSNKFSYEIPGARYLPAVRLGRWNGRVSFFQLGGSTYINLLEEILPYLDERGYDIELNDLRTYNTSFTFTEVTKDTFSHKVWPKGHRFEGQPIVLRDYQIEIINQFLIDTQCIQEIATGAGKTLITAALSYKCEPYGRTIVIVPNKDLVKQTEADYINLGLDVGVYFGTRKEYNKTHTICTWQSLNNLLKDTKAGSVDFTIMDFLDDVVCVICDECHGAKADALKTLLTGVMSHIPLRWGLTGTIPKEQFEYMSLLCSIGKVVGKLSAAELQDQGVLSNCHINIMQLIDHVEYKDYQSELKYLLSTEKRLEFVAKMIENISDEGNTLVLVDRISAGETLAGLIKNSVFLSGNTKDTDRKEHYDDVAVSDGKVLVCTYGVAAVGINVPRLFNIVLVEPGKSFVRVIQSIGRGLRKADDKDHVEIYDITSTCKFSKRHLTSRKKFYSDAQYPYTITKVDWQQ